MYIYAVSKLKNSTAHPDTGSHTPGFLLPPLNRRGRGEVNVMEQGGSSYEYLCITWVRP